VPGKEFSFRVKAVDTAGNESALSSPVTGAPRPTSHRRRRPPTCASRPPPSSVSLAWDRSTDSWGFGYQVLMDGVVAGAIGDLKFRLRHLTPGTTHTFAIRARDRAGQPLAEQQRHDRHARVVERPDAAEHTGEPDRQPAGRRLLRSNVLQWSASTDDVDPPSAIEYEIYQNGTLRKVTAAGHARAWNYPLAGTNTWTVVAVDRAGNSSGVSNPATLTVRQDDGLC
jgi:hypothetical protein